MKSFLQRILSRTFSNLKLRSHCPKLVTILNKDAWHEILLRVDPNTIFNCILVNKEWLEVIIDPEFRRNYNRRWKNISKVVGFFKSGFGHPFRLSATTKLGSTVNETKLPAGLGQFIAKSSSGDGLILSGIPPSTFFVSDLITGSVLVRLPPPPAVFDNPAVAIISSYHEDSCFTVIIAATDDDQDHEALNLAGSDDDEEPEFLLNIQTFSSSTGEWEQSTRRCSMYFNLSGELGAVSSNGLVYLRGTTVNDFGCVAVYDTKSSDHSKDVGLIFQPGLMQISAFANRNVYHAYYVVCSEGRLWSATRRVYTDEDWQTGLISVWVLEDDGIDWKLQYNLNPTSIWEKNLKLLKHIYKVSPRSSFDFVSFAPGRSDSVYLRLGTEIFVYHLDTGKLQLYGPKYHSADTGLIPVTVAETGAWPSSPLSPTRLIRSSRSSRSRRRG